MEYLEVGASTPPFFGMRSYEFQKRVFYQTYRLEVTVVPHPRIPKNTASQPFQCLIVSIMNGFARLRFEFITHNQCHTPTFELWVVTILAQVP